MSKSELLRRLNDYENVDPRDFHTNGKPDLEKAKGLGKDHVISSLVFSGDGTIESISLENDRSGYIYLLGADNGLTKIGTTQNISARMSSLKTVSPIPLHLLHSTWHIDAQSLEGYLHKMYSDQRSHGEWFDLDDDALRAAKTTMDNLSDGEGP